MRGLDRSAQSRNARSEARSISSILAAVLASLLAALAFTLLSAGSALADAGNSENYKVSATASSGLPVTFSASSKSKKVCTLEGSMVSFIGEGTCTIIAKQAGNEEWAPAEATQSFKVFPEGEQEAL